MKNLNYTAPINDLSYGVVGGNLLIEMQKMMIDVALWPINVSTQNPAFLRATQEAFNKQSTFDPHAPSLRLWHQFSMAQHIGCGPRWGYTIFEKNVLNEQEKRHLGWLDRIIVCSQWAKDIVEDQLGRGGINVDVAPLGVDPNIFYPKDKSDPNWTTFLNIGKWEYRKGHDVLIAAFNKAFEPRDRVRLWMACWNPFLAQQTPDGNLEWEKLYKNSKMGNNITILPYYCTQQELHQVMCEVDCGVFPSRAEGWNLPLLEMMACGKHTIATNYSAHTEFCNKDTTDLIDTYDEEECYDGIWFHGEGKWAKLDNSFIDELAQAMRAIYTINKSRPDTYRSNAAIMQANRFTWRRTTENVLGLESNCRTGE